MMDFDEDAVNNVILYHNRHVIIFDDDVDERNIAKDFPVLSKSLSFVDFQRLLLQADHDAPSLALFQSFLRNLLRNRHPKWIPRLEVDVRTSCLIFRFLSKETGDTHPKTGMPIMLKNTYVLVASSSSCQGSFGECCSQVTCDVNKLGNN